MKTRFVIGALVLAAMLVVAGMLAVAGILWRKWTIEVHSTISQRPERVFARSSYRNLSLLPGSPRAQRVDICVTAFITRRGKAWVGPEQQFYIETPSGVVGGKMMGGRILWCESLIAIRPDDGSDVGRLLERFEKEVNETALAEAMHGLRWTAQPLKGKGIAFAEPYNGGIEERTDRFTHLENIFVFSPAPIGVLAKLDSVQVRGNVVRLDFKDRRPGCDTTAWIDIKTRKLLKTAEDSNRMFAK